MEIAPLPAPRVLFPPFNRARPTSAVRYPSGGPQRHLEPFSRVSFPGPLDLDRAALLVEPLDFLSTLWICGPFGPNPSAVGSRSHGPCQLGRSDKRCGPLDLNPMFASKRPSQFASGLNLTILLYFGSLSGHMFPAAGSLSNSRDSFERSDHSVWLNLCEPSDS